MNQFVLTDDAELDLYEILDYLTQRNPAASERLERALLAEFADLAKHPLLHRVREELSAAPVRVHVYDNYLIFYNPGERPLTILRIVHGKRDLPFVLKGLDVPND